MNLIPEKVNIILLARIDDAIWPIVSSSTEGLLEEAFTVWKDNNPAEWAFLQDNDAIIIKTRIDHYAAIE